MFRNYKQITRYTSHAFILGDDEVVRTVEDGLNTLVKELENNPNIFGSVSFANNIFLDVDEGLYTGHQYRILDYDTKSKIVKLINPHDSNKYMEIPLEIFEKAEPDFSVFEIEIPKF